MTLLVSFSYLVIVAWWCNGSTEVFGTFSWGSSPCRAATFLKKSVASGFVLFSLFKWVDFYIGTRIRWRIIENALQLD